MTLESSKTLGGIGAILLFIGVIPVLSYLWVIGLVGVILVLVALRGFANYYRENGIFTNAIYGVGAGVVGGIIAAILALAVVLSNIRDLVTQIYPGWNGDWASLQNMTPDTSNLDPTTLLPLIGGLLAVFVVIWVFAIVATFFIRRSLKQVSAKTSVGLYGTAGLLLLIGAFLVIAFGLGLLLMWIAALLLAIAFFQTKPQLEQPPAPTQSYLPPTPV